MFFDVGGVDVFDEGVDFCDVGVGDDGVEVGYFVVVDENFYCFGGGVLYWGVVWDENDVGGWVFF